ncbi:hypothetical protein GCM10010917_21650 [Paenibacillus physcomitrellae]|uniref:Uncharacterized protein n=1 Tax=Paenibacillus physcomitrellae TaxID=1619311 RepID=A0ABQ1G5H6_9BACL|nr:hypothetical protein GCM10010917_21650 [Paenibacillus physcomitrellae]
MPEGPAPIKEQPDKISGSATAPAAAVFFQCFIRFMNGVLPTFIGLVCTTMYTSLLLKNNYIFCRFGQLIKDAENEVN